jgi:hypothetical protein
MFLTYAPPGTGCARSANAGVKPDGLVNPVGPTIHVLNGSLQLPYPDGPTPATVSTFPWPRGGLSG